jgi:hypothetical protein
MRPNACIGNGPPVIWLSFWDAYRTLCIDIPAEIRACCFVSMIAEWFFCTPLLRRSRKHLRQNLNWR